MLPEQTWDEKTFASLKEEERTTLLYAQHRELRARVGALESGFTKLEQQISDVVDVLSDKMDLGFQNLKLEMKPLVSERDAKAAVDAAAALHWKNLKTYLSIGASAVVILAALIAGFNTLGGLWLKTEVHVPIPTVEVAPPPSMDPLHPTGD